MAKIISDRVGTPGDNFDIDAAVEAGVNVDALIEHGFISVDGAAKSARKKSTTPPDGISEPQE